jgi:hypothetical protein
MTAVPCCRECKCTLPPRAPGQRGRPPVFCDAACRSLWERDRKRLAVKVRYRRRKLEDTQAKLARGYSGITPAFVALDERLLAEAEAELARYTRRTHAYRRRT